MHPAQAFGHPSEVVADPERTTTAAKTFNRRLPTRRKPSSLSMIDISIRMSIAAHAGGSAKETSGASFSCANCTIAVETLTPFTHAIVETIVRNTLGPDREKADIVAARVRAVSSASDLVNW